MVDGVEMILSAYIKFWNINLQTTMSYKRKVIFMYDIVTTHTAKATNEYQGRLVFLEWQAYSVIAIFLDLNPIQEIQDHCQEAYLWTRQ